MTNAIILAGGFGTRLRSVVPNLPKPLAPIGGRPFLAMQLEWLRRCSVEKVCVTAHYMADKIENFIKDIDANNQFVSVVVENEPLGTGGAVAHAYKQSHFDDDTVVLNGDTHYEFDLDAIVMEHKSRKAWITMVVTEVEDCSRFGTITTMNGKLKSFVQASGRHESGYVNCGLYIISPAAMATAPNGAFSLELDYFPQLVGDGLIDIYPLEGEGVFYDIGTPDAYAEFCKRYE